MSDLLTMQKLTLKNCVAPISINGTAATATAIDTLGYKSAMFIFHSGLIGAATFDELRLTQCATSGGSYTAVTDSTMTDPVDADDGKIWVWYVDLSRGGYERFFKIDIDPGAAATLVSSLCILGDADEAPNTAAERGITGEQKLLP